MRSKFPAVSRLLVALGVLGIAVVCVVAGSARAGYFDGETYRFASSGTMQAGMDSGILRTFGSAPTNVINTSGGLNTPYCDFWDEEDTTGLGPGQVRLKFFMTDRSPFPGTYSGAVALTTELDLFGLDLPSGASFLPETARVTYGFPDGLNPVVLGPTYLGSGVFYTSGQTCLTFRTPWSGAYDPVNHPDPGSVMGSGEWATEATFEVVVDNVPEPITLGLLGAGAGVLALVNRRLRNRR